jgi:long-chain acyl-CoA synthetase
MTWDDILEAGKKSMEKQNYKSVTAKPDDCFMFSYTSGTTGDPKGVKLTHKMIIGAAWAAMNHVSVAFSNADSYISYLPAAHSFE